MKLTATTSDAGKRADIWLHEQMPDMSRARIQSLIEARNILIDGKAFKPHTRVIEGMSAEVSIPPPRETALLAEDIPLDILHEDSDIIVVNKQAGLVVHPAAGHPSGTLVNALLHHCADLEGIGGELRPGIVHRLDRDTTGVIVVAKNEHAMQHITAQFKNVEIKKVYVAIVCGVPDPQSDTIETLIGRAGHDRKKMSARPRSGRTAITHYAVIETFSTTSLLRIRIETGRTHQIRVHMAHIGHPLLGDGQYSSAKRQRLAAVSAPRQMLHAAHITISHPRTEHRMTFKAPLPGDMELVLEQLRSSAGKSGTERA